MYATCSLLEAENEAVIAGFLSAHPGFRVLPARALLEKQGIAVADEAGDYLRLLPHRHGTDGFFAAAMERCE